MKVKRVQREDVKQAYPRATESPIPFWADGVPLCREWFAENLGKSIEGFHLVDEEGNTIGYIYWAPSRHALVPYEIEDKVACIYCATRFPETAPLAMRRVFGGGGEAAAPSPLPPKPPSPLPQWERGRGFGGRGEGKKCHQL